MESQRCNNRVLYWSVLKGIKTDKKGERIAQIQYDDLFNIDRWYESCKSFTFPTLMLDLTVEEANALSQSYESYIRNPSFSASVPQLESRIQAALDQMDAKVGGFVRLSARSPKDSGFADDRMKKVLTEKLEKMKENSRFLNDVEIQNEEWKAFFESQIESLRIFSGKEAVKLLSKSERVSTDIKIAFELQQLNQKSGDGWKVKVATRKWEEHSIAMEFRGFMFQRKLTALSQYFDMIFFPEVFNNKQTILKRIKSFFNEIVDQIPFESCVVDFVIIGDVEDGRIQVIEFNPWSRFTSACLFNWKRDLDVFEGRAPFQFRILEEPLEVLRRKEEFRNPSELMFNISSEVMEEYSDILDLVKSHLSDEYERINADLRYVLNKREK